MREALELAGFFAAHAIWCVSDGGPLVPLGALQLSDGRRNVCRFMDEEELARAVARGKEWLDGRLEDALYATLIYDGYLTLGDWRTDALFIEVRSFGGTLESLSMAVPYRDREDKAGFAVYRPKFIDVSKAGPEDYEGWAEAFFGGVDGHEQGSKVWNAHIDQSR
jgi:hypothetical protein